MNVHTMSIVVDLRELEALRRSRLPATGPADEYPSKLIPTRAKAGFVVDLLELEALRRSRVLAAGLAGEYLRKLVPARAEAGGPAFDFWAGTPLVSDLKARLH